MRDSGLSAHYGCTGCGKSQAFYPRVCLCRRCRCCCRVLLLALLVPPLFGVPREHRLQQVRPKVVRCPIDIVHVNVNFTLPIAVPRAEKLGIRDACVCVDKRGDSRLLKPFNPRLPYLRCVPRPQRHNGRVCAWSSRVVVSYVEGDGTQSPLGLRLPAP